MHKSLIIGSILSIFMGMSFSAQAQKKVWVSGAARGVVYGDEYALTESTDTTTARRTESGHTMVDLGVNIQPSEQILIQGMVRIRNDYGGFWGSGVTFDVRQLYIKGILGGFLRYQLGDIDYRLSEYTFSNTESLVNSFAGEITSTPLDQARYDVFYTENGTWRQQGAAIDFALEFRSVMEEARFDFYTTRIRPTDFNNIDDRLYSGGSVVLVQSEQFQLGGQYTNLYDLSGTSDATVFLRNPAMSLSSEFKFDALNTDFTAFVEAGRSTLRWEGSDVAPELNDFFYDARLKASWPSIGLDITGGYREVGPNYRAPGAQTMRINYQSRPRAYQRYGNDQQLRRLSLLDLSRDVSLYQTQITAGLMEYDPRYDNATPYGVATPNRRGFTVDLSYKVMDGLSATAKTEMLQDVVGLGTTAITNYNTTTFGLQTDVAKWTNLGEREISIGAQYGMQGSGRTGEAAYESIDLGSTFMSVNLKASLVSSLYLIGEWRTWQTEGNTLVANRDEYSQINDFTEYNIDYSEQILGAGFLYEFSERTALRLMYQNFNWQDEGSLPYRMNTWTIFFNMKF